MTKPGQTMTNATVKQVITSATVKQISGGQTTVIKLAFHGAGPPGSENCTGRAADAPGGPGKGCVGETEFEVPANVPVVAQLPAEPSVLTAGAKANVVIAQAQRPSDGHKSHRLQITGHRPRCWPAITIYSCTRRKRNIGSTNRDGLPVALALR